MFTQRKICCTHSGTTWRLTVIVSSSPLPSPVRLSPLCTRPAAWRFPKNTASRLFPWLSKSTAETSRSISCVPVSQPNPTTIWSMAADWGRSTTAPFSIAKATFTRFGAPGVALRMMLPMVGSRTSMKCWPGCAGSSTILSDQPPASDLVIAATTSTFSVLCSIENKATSFSLRSSSTWILPFCTSRSRPPRKAATTKITIRTCAASLSRPTQMVSSRPLFSPLVSSPECVMHFSALRLL
mmetsp:Transcript_94547/g.267620  ORF Transcript_94547/g.267620 Transcript_94547/m.267620 type:complete len:240 (-) Transcript_94547:205-924(-)